MKKAKDFAKEIIDSFVNAQKANDSHLLTQKLTEVFLELTRNEITELKVMRHIKTDSGLIPVFKEQRQKYNSICKHVNAIHDNLLDLNLFDELIGLTYPNIFEWYKANVLV